MKYQILIFCLFCTTISFGQPKTFYGEIHVECVVYNGDTFKFEIPKIIVIKKLGITPIISFGKMRESEFGVQYEMLKSNLGDSAYHMLGKCFFKKTSIGWEEIARFDYHGIHFEPGPVLAEISNTPMDVCGAEKNGLGFETGSWYIFYKL